MNIKLLRRKLWNRANKELVRFLVPRCRLVARGFEADLERLGTDYGGWWLPTCSLEAGDVAYCIGAGCDISFDLALAASRNVEVHVFDPSPQSVEMLANAKLPNRVFFHPFGVWDEDAELLLYFDREGKQLSAFDVDATEEAIQLPVRRLRTLMAMLGHESIDLLKIDIEGAWQRVLGDLAKSGVRPKVVLVEFDSPVNVVSAIRAIILMRKIGLHLVFVEKDNYVFVCRRNRE